MQYILWNLKARKKEKFIMVFLFVVLSLVFVWLSGIGEYRPLLQSEGRGGIEFFYNVMNGGILIWNYILCILILPNLFSVDYLIDKKAGFLPMVKTRLGYKKNFRLSVLTNFIFTAFTILLVQTTILLFIHFFLSPIHFNVDVTPELTSDAHVFASNEMISLVIFMMFSAIGYGVFSTFLFSLQTIIQNVYVYRLIGIILGLLLYTGTVLIADITSFLPFVHNILLFFFVGHLINPGVMSTSIIQNISPYITFGFTLLIYTVISILLLRKLSKKEYTYD